MRASSQLAVNDMTSPAITVAMFWTTWAKASPTRLLTVEASVDNLAPTAPLKRNKKFHFGCPNEKERLKKH